MGGSSAWDTETPRIETDIASTKALMRMGFLHWFMMDREPVCYQLALGSVYERDMWP
jgi:hypothetical protein